MPWAFVYWSSLFFLSCSTFELLYIKLRRLPNIFNPKMMVSDFQVSALKPFAVLATPPILAFYQFLFDHTVRWHLAWNDSNVLHWFFALLLADFTFYVFHVAAHRWNILWGMHLVHHQSTSFNLLVSGRNSFIEGIFHLVRALPLAMIGLPRPMCIASILLTSHAMFWLHTRVIKHTGPLEWILNTPSHHRVHHFKHCSTIGGSRNFGGAFIIWDRIFGTFLKEGSEIEEFGIEQASPKHQPLYSQFFLYSQIFQSIRHTGWKEGLQLAFSGAPLRACADESDHHRTRFSRHQLLYCFSLSFLGSLALIRAMKSLMFPETNFRSGSAVALFLGVIALALAAIYQVAAANRERIPRGTLLSFLTLGTPLGIFVWISFRASSLKLEDAASLALVCSGVISSLGAFLSVNSGSVDRNPRNVLLKSFSCMRSQEHEVMNQNL